MLNTTGGLENDVVGNPSCICLAIFLRKYIYVLDLNIFLLYFLARGDLIKRLCRYTSEKRTERQITSPFEKREDAFYHTGGN